MDNSIIFFIVGLIVLGLGLTFAIAEFWGRTKHIGRLWSMLLLLTGDIFGIIAIAASPKANKPPTKGHNGHLAFGIIFIILSIIIMFLGINLMIDGQSSYNEKEYYAGLKGLRGGFGVLFLGIYLIQLYRGKIVNHNPRGNANPSTIQQPNHYNNQTYNNTPSVNTPTQPNNSGSFYNGGHNAMANNQPPQRKPQGGKGEFNGNLYN